MRPRPTSSGAAVLFLSKFDHGSNRVRDLRTSLHERRAERSWDVRRDCERKRDRVDLYDVERKENFIKRQASKRLIRQPFRQMTQVHSRQKAPSLSTKLREREKEGGRERQRQRERERGRERKGESERERERARVTESCGSIRYSTISECVLLCTDTDNLHRPSYTPRAHRRLLLNLYNLCSRSTPLTN